MSRQATADVLLPRERASASVQGAASRKASEPRAPAIDIGSLGAPTRGAATRSLAEQQSLFMQAITTAETSLAGLDARALATLVTASATLTALERLDIYRSGYHARLVECLVDDYPVLQHALGEAAFESLCRDYIVRHPSRGPSLNVFGQHMAEFCRDAVTASGFFAELAALEWAIVEAIHAPGGSILQLADLVSVPQDAWPAVKLLVNPSLRVLTCSYPANAYFQAFRAGEAPSVPAPSLSVVAVYRTGRAVWRLPLSAAMRELLALLAAGNPLAAATSEVTVQLADHSEDEAASLVTSWFSSAVSSGLFSSVQLPSAE